MLNSPIKSPAKSPLLSGLGASNPPAGAVERIVNGGFADATNWTVTAPWTISSGVATNDGTSGGFLSQTITALVPAGNYTLTWTITANAGADTILAQAFDGVVTSQNISSQSAPGTYIVPFVASAAHTVIRFRNTTVTDGGISIDDISLI